MNDGILELDLEQEVSRAGDVLAGSDVVLVRFGAVRRINAQKAAQRSRHYHIGLKCDYNYISKPRFWGWRKLQARSVFE